MAIAGHSLPGPLLLLLTRTLSFSHLPLFPGPIAAIADPSTFHYQRATQEPVSPCGQTAH
jgi:hypothetical protein